jgi:hypothetical protein
MGIFTNPRRALYNRIYNRTTISLDNLLRISGKIKSISNSSQQMNKPHPENAGPTSIGNIIRSSNRALTVTSKNFEELRKQITNIRNQRLEIIEKLNAAKIKLILLSIAHFGSYLIIVGFFIKKIAELRKVQISIVDNFENQLAETFLNLTFTDKSQIEKSWLNCVDAFKELMCSEKIWDVTYSEEVDKVKARTTAQTAIKRTLIKKTARDNDILKSDLPYLFLPNANGPDLFFYPTFLLFLKNNEEFGIFDLNDINTVMKLSRYIEEENMPNDTEIIEHTWKKSNKDGSMDKRFKGNYQIPIVKYGEITLKSENKLEESFMFSNPKAFEEFAKTYEYHVSLLNKI